MGVASNRNCVCCCAEIWREIEQTPYERWAKKGSRTIAQPENADSEENYSEVEMSQQNSRMVMIFVWMDTAYDSALLFG